MTFTIALIAGGCDTQGESTIVFSSPDGQTPRVEAIEFRGPNNSHLGMIGPGSYRCGVLYGDEEAMTWEDPDEGYLLRFNVLAGYPNPTPDFTMILLELPHASRVAIFAVPALGPLDPILGHRGLNAHGASVFIPGGRAVHVLQDEHLQRGSHYITWAAHEATFAGAPLPHGYYRIYVQTEYALGCSDVLYTAASPFDLI